MGHEETEKSVEEIVDMIKKGDLSLAPKLYEQTKGIICYVIWREWRREHIRRGAKARGMEVEDLQQEGYFMMLQSAQLYDSSIGANFKTYLFAHSLRCSDPPSVHQTACGCCPRRWRVSLP